MSDSPRPEIFVVGAGGIGCAVGHALCTGGVEVTFVELARAKVAWGNEHGVGLDDRPRLPARFVSFEGWRPPESAIVLLTTKCFDNDVVLARLPDSVAVMPIQNGFHRALMERSAIEGIASFVSECRDGQTHTDITRQRRPARRPVGGRPRPTASGRDGAAARSPRAAWRVPRQRVADVLPYKYSKLMYNAAIAPLAAVAGLDNSRLLTIPKARRLFFRMLRENYRILTAAGVTLGVVGPFHPDTVERILRTAGDSADHGVAVRPLAEEHLLLDVW